MNASIAEAFTFVTKNDFSTIWRRIRQRDVPWVIQLGLYGACGLMAFAITLVATMYLNEYVIPANKGHIIDGVPITDAMRAKNALINNTIVWAVVNVFVYFMNVMFVFKGGRHHPVVEFLYFTFVNSISFLFSQFAGPWLILHYGVDTTLALFTNMFAAVIINFIARKFFVFKG